MSFFCSVLATDHITTILLNPGAQERTEMFVYALFLYIPIFYFFSIRATFKLINPIKNAFLIKISIVWFYFILFRIIQGFISGSNVSLYELFSQVIIFYIGCTFAEYTNSKNWPLFLILTFLISAGIILYFSYSIYSSNAYSLSGLMYLEYLRPQHKYGLIQSTEFSNYCAQIFIIGLVSVMYRKLFIHYKKYLFLIYIISLILLFLIFILFSVGTLVGLLLISLFLFYRKRKYYLILTFIIFIVAIYSFSESIQESIQFLQNLFYYKESDTVRQFLYSTSIDLISENPFWGIGRGRFFDIYGYYPHQNFLGTWTEGGLPLFLFYSGLIILVINVYVRLRRHLVVSNDRLMLSVAFAILFFWHFKGLMQDTWNNVSIYFWTGIITGVYLKYTTSINAVRYHWLKKRN